MEDLPFDIPDNWTWIRHNSIYEIFGGSQPPKSKFITEPKEGYIRLYQIRDYGPKPDPIYIPIKDAHKDSNTYSGSHLPKYNLSFIVIEGDLVTKLSFLNS